jgi:hypothetical protein
MKRRISHFLLLLAALTMFYCSDEQITPRDTDDAPTEDPSTSMKAYSPNVFAIEIATIDGSSVPPTLVEMEVGGTGGKIAVNWGDGTIEKITLTPALITLRHQYERAKNYVIKIDGQITNIEVYRLTYQSARFKNFYLSGLTGLKEFDIVLSNGPSVINLSHNKLIESLGLVGVNNLQDVILPTANNIRYISVAGPNQISTAVIDRIVGRVYQSVVNNPRAGTFTLSTEWWHGPEPDDEMVGPPSGYSITKLNKLKNTYGWNINPAPDNN